MAEYSGVEAGARLGVSIDTIKRMVRRGELRGYKDAAGRWRVHLEEPAGPVAAEASAPADGALIELRARLEVTEVMVAEMRTQLDAYRKQIEAEAVERAELRRLLSTALQRPQLPATVEGVLSESAGNVPVQPRNLPAGRPFWAFWRPRVPTAG